MIRAGHIARNRKGDHTVATGRGDTRALARKRLNGLVKRIARTVSLILGPALKLELLIAAFNVILHSVFELVKVILKTIFDRSRRCRDSTER